MSSDTDRPSPQPSPSSSTPSGEEGNDATTQSRRMSFGDHLEELRSCLIRALLGLGLAGIVCLTFGRQILEIIFRPLLIVQYANDLPMQLQALAPMAGFVAYLKISLLCGLILSMPWILGQVWKFISTGLYPNERRFVQALMPASIGLFVLGVLFLYFVVLPIVLHFFIRFNNAFDLPDVSGSVIARLFAEDEEVATEEGEKLEHDHAAQWEIPILRKDPAPESAILVWFNERSGKLNVRTAEGVSWVRLTPERGLPTVQSQFALDFYISFVLMLALAFGIAFELPIAVFFLAWTGIVSAAAMAKGRRYVLLGIVVAAAMLTPPDLVSQVLLALPMYGLFELGLLVARRTERRQTSA